MSSKKKPSIRSESVPFFCNNELSAQQLFGAPNAVNRNMVNNGGVSNNANNVNNVNNVNAGNNGVNNGGDPNFQFATVRALSGINGALHNLQNQLGHKQNDDNNDDESSEDIFMNIGGAKTFQSFNVGAFARESNDRYLGQITGSLITKQRSMNGKLTDANAMNKENFVCKFVGYPRFMMDSLLITAARKFAKTEHGKDVETLRSFLVTMTQVMVEFDKLCMRYGMDVRMAVVRQLGAMIDVKNDKLDILQCVQDAIKEATHNESMLNGWNRNKLWNNNKPWNNNNNKNRYGGGGNKSGYSRDYVPNGFCIHHHKYNNCTKKACGYEHKCPTCKKEHSRKLCPVFNGNGANSSTAASSSGKDGNQ